MGWLILSFIIAIFIGCNLDGRKQEQSLSLEITENDGKINTSKKPSITVIDVTNEAERARQFLRENWWKYTNYDEFEQLKEEDKLPILEYIWENVNIHGSFIRKNLKIKYPYYDKKIIDLVGLCEGFRIHNLIKVYHDDKAHILSDYYFVECRDEAEFTNTIIHKSDIAKIQSHWYMEDGIHIQHYGISYIVKDLNSNIAYIQDKIKDLKEIKLFLNDDIIIIPLEYFDRFCEENNIDLRLKRK